MIPVLLIGLGRIASLLEKDRLRSHPCTHAGTIFSPWGRKKFSLLGAIDPSEERRITFCKDWNIPKTLCFCDFKEWSISFRSITKEGSDSSFPNQKDSRSTVVRNAKVPSRKKSDLRRTRKCSVPRKSFEFRRTPTGIFKVLSTHRATRVRIQNVGTPRTSIGNDSKWNPPL